jgi:voltage-gated potassium channel Kch
MDRGTPALIGWLALASLVLIAAVTSLVAVLAPHDTADNQGWLEIAWMSLLRTLDPGTMGGDQGTPIFLGLMLTATLGGIFLVSALIGILTNGLDNRIVQLRKGRSIVLERGHAVILGWSDQVFIVVSELVKANQGGGRSCVVILADRDKVDMEDQIRAQVGDLGKLRVICRSGSPLKRVDLELVSLDTARSVIVLSPPEDDPDIDVIKTLLLLQHRRWGQERPPIVAAIQDSSNMPGARLAAGPNVRLIDADDISVRLVAQSHRQSGLSTVCTDLLDFSGNELYIRAEPRLVGRTYAEVLVAYDQGCPIGLLRADGTVALNPPMDTGVAAGDRIVVMAEDDLLIRPAKEVAPINAAAIVPAVGTRPEPDRTALIGWNSRGPKIIDLLDRLVEPGSVLDIAHPTKPVGAIGRRTNVTVDHKECDPTSRASLESLDLGNYNHLVVLSDEHVDRDRADDRTLITLLHLRDIAAALGNPYTIVTEMNDDANREIAQTAKADDFIISTKLISLLMTQLAENVALQAVFADLFDPSGSEIYLNPASGYVLTDHEITFATVVEACRQRGETPIGLRFAGHCDEPPSYGVVLNPAKSTTFTLSPQDSVIVVSPGSESRPSRAAASTAAVPAA